jgi:hypothetical protein
MRYNNYGTLNNFDTPLIVNGFKSKAIQFDGVNDYISTGLLSSGISGDLTFSCFVKTSTKKTVIIADIAQESKSGLKLGINTDGKLYLNAAEAGLTANLIGTTKMNDGEWHFIALRREGSKYQLYIDVSTPIASGKGSVQKFDKLIVGAKNDGSDAFEGIIDEVKLYDSAIEEASFTRNMTPFCPLKLTITTKGMIMRLNWVDQSNNEDGFLVERKTKDGKWQELTARVGADKLNYSDTVKLYNTEYSYRVRAFNKFGKSDPSFIQTKTSPLEPTNTGISEKKSDSGNIATWIYPNPAKDELRIVSIANVKLQIFDIQGKLMLTKNNLSGEKIIDINSLPQGLYILKTFENNKINVFKLIKQ